MSKRFQLSEDVIYSFSDYFKTTSYVQDIVNYFDYQFSKTAAENLPSCDIELLTLPFLKSFLQKSIRHVSLTNEMARREFLIAPVLAEVADYADAQIRVEYSIHVNNQLNGTLDYFLEKQSCFLIVEAKKADLEQGFLQLAVELIALDKWLDADINANLLYGAVSTGDIWRFGILNRETKTVIQDLNLFRVPADVEDLLRVMVGILKNQEKGVDN